MFMLVVALLVWLPAQAQDDVNTLEEQIVTVYDTVSPSVVNISATTITFDFFRRPIPQEGSGSGFFFDNQGHIVTNFHVIEGARELQVTVADGRSTPATVVGVDPSNDLAVLQVDPSMVIAPPAPPGDSDNLRVGEFVFAIGNPFGLERTLTMGIVSSLGRIIESPDGRFIGEVVQTDAAVNPGNSGGPLLNRRGELIGVNTAIFSPTGSSAGIGFAIPVNTVMRVVPALIRDGFYQHPWLGIGTFDLTPERARALRQVMPVPTDTGILITETAPGAPADIAGIRGGRQRVRFGNIILPIGGDIITAINGEPIADTRDLNIYLETHTEVGQTVDVTVIRDGQTFTTQATLQARPTR